jgi:phage tail tape-measure protein
MGQQGMDEIALVLGQMKSLGRIQGGDLLQLAQHGVNGYGLLEKGAQV